VTPIVLIPSRLASTRLPNKPLADIHGEPMIVHVWRRGVEAGLGRVVVASAEESIAAAIRRAGGEAVMTDPAHLTGSDRINEALQRLDPERRHDVVVNLQGDMPTIAPEFVRAVTRLLDNPAVDIGTLAVVIREEAERTLPNVVKVVAPFPPEALGGAVARALYFSRATVPANPGPHYHHPGIYAYRREALERFVALPRGILEARENLEQLRALEAGMRIEVALVDTLPLNVDTPADLERARALLAPGRSLPS
jgi:3-deoxy-manno-octulosonate cytidylyltransferase (CMP-KDO synthetase)